MAARQIWRGALLFRRGSTSAKILDAPGPILEFPGIKNAEKKKPKTKKTDKTKNLKMGQTIRETGVFAKWQNSWKKGKNQKKN